MKVADLSDDQFKAMVKHILPGYGLGITTRTIDTWAKLLVDKKQMNAPKTRSEIIDKVAPEHFTCSN